MRPSILLFLLAFVLILMTIISQNVEDDDFHNGDSHSRMEISNRIINHYKDHYENSAITKEYITESTIELWFYNRPKDPEDVDYLLLYVSIPKASDITDHEKYNLGDLNRDSKHDLIVEVYTEGGGVGALSQRGNDYFIFIDDEDIFLLTKVISDKELAFCGNGGWFSVSNIHNNKVSGISSCYDLDDPRCCPSLAFYTELELFKNEIKLVSQEIINQ